ncbi:hypothetical protein NL532_11780 [Mesorhizobium sp. C120A]|uniref:hypothetical protein n=1 Tax=unclassified Mesorhizobium TaxID=325217 RepID=UPI0003CFBAD2|nr:MULTISPECIES: hypothetical protein [unclassified Mesorhizobium]ESZ54541.1 hypothetical protein X728_31395 [Mesorhizobium sp. L103C120A0]WJI47251.1 hypothetical protein NL532_11780 [Mesorhizobium sp. C120A]
MAGYLGVEAKSQREVYNACKDSSFENFFTIGFAQLSQRISSSDLGTAKPAPHEPEDVQLDDVCALAHVGASSHILVLMLRQRMKTGAAPELTQRQVLVNLGNRYVLFGPDATRPEALKFHPDKDSELLPRVSDESEVAGERIIETARASDVDTLQPANDATGYDLVAQDSRGHRTYIQVKVRERDPKARDFEELLKQITTVPEAESSAEVWYFNIERLKLAILTQDSKGYLKQTILKPLDVWEKTESGIFRREQVVERVEDWTQRIAALYADIERWLSDRANLKIEQARSVVMSEELMQKYAVPEREIAILDVLEKTEPVLSFVPRALYVFGARGRVDVITRNGTHLLVDQGVQGRPNWRLVSQESRRETIAFDETALESLVGAQ